MHGLLREFQTLAELLEEFVEWKIGRMSDAGPSAAVQAMRRLSAAVRAIH
ncbi:MAG TPA: hypothetical protein VMO26_23525 [Vicinamibacterales bacterium]|nr:hypothetical protein [Vicinamibacterales bacterium]